MKIRTQSIQIVVNNSLTDTSSLSNHRRVVENAFSKVDVNTRVSGDLNVAFRRILLTFIQLNSLLITHDQLRHLCIASIDGSHQGIKFGVLIPINSTTSA